MSLAAIGALLWDDHRTVKWLEPAIGSSVGCYDAEDEN